MERAKKEKEEKEAAAAEVARNIDKTKYQLNEPEAPKVDGSETPKTDAEKE